MAGIVAKIIVFILTFSIWVMGILMIIFGSIGLADPSLAIEMLSVAAGSDNLVYIIDVYALLYGMSVFMITLGSLLFVFGWIGCHGAARLHKLSLFLFWITLLASIVFEVALIIYAAVYPGKMITSIQTEMEVSLRDDYPNRTSVSIVDGSSGEIAISTTASDSAVAWENLQYEVHCCGAGLYGYKDYKQMSKTPYSYSTPDGSFLSEVPISCCRSDRSNGNIPTNTDQFDSLQNCLGDSPPTSVWTVSCWKVVDDMVDQFSYISIILCSCLIGAEIIAVIFSIRMWKLAEK